MAEETALLDDRSFNLGGIHRIFREQDTVFENFSRAKRNGNRNRSGGKRRRLNVFLGRLGLLRQSYGSESQRQQRRSRSEAMKDCACPQQ
jgi:hypothetical protein